MPALPPPSAATGGSYGGGGGSGSRLASPAHANAGAVERLGALQRAALQAEEDVRAAEEGMRGHAASLTLRAARLAEEAEAFERVQAQARAAAAAGVGGAPSRSSSPMRLQQRSEAQYQGGGALPVAAGTSPARVQRSESLQVLVQAPVAAAYIPAPEPARAPPPRPSDGEVLQVVRQLPVEAFRM